MIDLHVHSTASDGTCPPEELAERGRAFSLMALTDHDNTDGCARFLSACRALGVPGLRLPGVELSVAPGAGYGQLHMLGLGIDPDAPDFAAFLARIRVGRAERNVRMLEKLASLGMPVTMDEVRRYAGGEVVALDGEEVPAARIGELVMERLHKLDEVAYIRFASVYRRFTDVKEFLQAITEMVKK